MIEPRRATNLPRIHPVAWHGPIGQAVTAIAPCTEADPVAILASCLALFGAAAGDAAYVRVGGVRHPARLWPLVVGKTGSGRKGTSWAEARRLGRGWGAYAAGYERNRVITGLASGEGLIGALGGAQGGKDGDDDGPVAPDGRLTVVETEFARVLNAAKREGNTLGPILRQLWDDGDAAVLTKTATKVTGAHLAVVAHVTPKELRLRLAESDLAGGTLNRFLLIASERPHLLAHERPHPDVTEQAEDLTKALDAARVGPVAGELRRDRDADRLWEQVYAALNADEPDGQLGSVLARGPVYTMRLALAYALADRAGAIGTRHLLAGLALWHYSTQTARMVFPEGQHHTRDLERLGQFIETADTAAGRTRNDITNLFRRNRSAAELQELITELERRGHTTVTREDPVGPGRPVYRYRWTGAYIDPMAAVLYQHAGAPSSSGRRAGTK